MARCKCAPSLVRLDNEIDALYPKRDHASDGCCGDADHQSRVSDHNARTSGPAKGYALALDIDEDLTPFTPGPDDLRWLRDLIWNNPSYYVMVKNMIYEGEIWYVHTKPGGRARGKYRYTGINAHKQHLHLGIFDAYYDWKGIWLPAHLQPEDDMFTPEDRKRLVEVHALLTNREDPNNPVSLTLEGTGAQRDSLMAGIRRHAQLGGFPVKEQQDVSKGV
jgi:hypothetical protein